FGHTNYKGKQKEIVRAAVLGYDVFVLAPTGMGKASKTVLHIALFLYLSNSLTISELQSLRMKGIPVVSLTSETPQYERQEVMQDLLSGDPEYRLLYVTPEKMGTGEFLWQLRVVYQRQRLSRLVLNSQAHCISEWGHDFRGDYRKLGLFRERFPGVPIMALTATATPAVQDDIVHSLNMDKGNLFKATHPFNRSNLFYEVKYASNPDQTSQMAEICDYICTLHRRRGKVSTGIIYCRTRATCNDLAAYLRGKGMSVKPYHKGIAQALISFIGSAATLDKTLAEWTKPGGSAEGGIDAVVATIAFGLGIDKGDVRYIIHYDLPKSFEGYYQETGRAGRNGSVAKCVLYYCKSFLFVYLYQLDALITLLAREDAVQVRRWVSDSHTRRVMTAEYANGPPPSQRSLSSLSELVKFAEDTNVCRHISICRYFGETIDSNDPEVVKSYCNMMCDVCKYPERTRSRRQALSSEDYASSQAPSVSSYGGDDDDDNVTHDTRRAEGKTGWGSLSRNGSRFAESGPGNASASRLGTVGSATSSKRTAAEVVTKPGGEPKKPKTRESLAPPLITKPFNSASDLKKPFKSPFTKAPPLEKSNAVNTYINQAQSICEPSVGLKTFSEDVMVIPEVAKASNRLHGRSPSPEEVGADANENTEQSMDIDILIELEDPSSTKIQVSSLQPTFCLRFLKPPLQANIRCRGAASILTALRTAFIRHPSLWNCFGSSQPRDKKE
ncbi:ATP-dependent DNA helicase, partial [Marasmius fiardii PR-910]